MHDPVTMRVLERAGDLDRVGQSLLEWHPSSCQSSGQRLTVEAFHHEEVDVVMTPDVVERADVRVRQRGNRSGLAREPRAQLRLERDAGGHDFDCNRTIEADINGAEDLAHAAGAEETLDSIGTKRRAATDVRTVREERRRRCPDRAIQDHRRPVLTEQRLDFLPERRISCAGFAEKLVAPRRIAIDSQLVDPCDLLPSLRSQGHL